LFVIVVIVVLFEMIVTCTRSMIFPSDVDIFQEYEQDREARKRFEEAAADYLQQGWDRGTKKSSFELAREAVLEGEREAQVQELLNRPRTMQGEQKTSRSQFRKRTSFAAAGDGEDGVRISMEEVAAVEVVPRRSVDAAELFSRGFGKVKKGPDLR